VENTLKKVPGVLDVKAKLIRRNLGEAGVRYDPARVNLEHIKRAVPMASGQKHKFIVTSVVERV